tara:strand:+ start:1499 stop:1726 length:228 start_codon:yes stop_codon:yes gene_type:complete
MYIETAKQRKGNKMSKAKLALKLVKDIADYSILKIEETDGFNGLSSTPDGHDIFYFDDGSIITRDQFDDGELTLI